mmetsp:Transcript_69247/g.225563  ORF Transcript_69247/g.225563 Transcript_69247/m.225563 type:complete len:278 (-) Transcript_69247:1136-1969(-)
MNKGVLFNYNLPLNDRCLMQPASSKSPALRAIGSDGVHSRGSACPSARSAARAMRTRAAPAAAPCRTSHAPRAHSPHLPRWPGCRGGPSRAWPRAPGAPACAWLRPLPASPGRGAASQGCSWPSASPDAPGPTSPPSPRALGGARAPPIPSRLATGARNPGNRRCAACRRARGPSAPPGAGARGGGAPRLRPTSPAAPRAWRSRSSQRARLDGPCRCRSLLRRSPARVCTMHPCLEAGPGFRRSGRGAVCSARCAPTRCPAPSRSKRAPSQVAAPPL